MTDSLRKNCHAANYVALTAFENENEINTLTLKDQITGDVKTITCNQTVFATGPFTDKLMDELGNIPWTPKLLPSKGSHLWLDKSKIELKHPMVLNDKSGRVIFVIPHEEAILVGTTEIHTDDNFFDLKVSNEEIEYLLENLNEYFPTAGFNKSDVISSFAGIRPLVREEDAMDPGKTSRFIKSISLTTIFMSYLVANTPPFESWDRKSQEISAPASRRLIAAPFQKKRFENDPMFRRSMKGEKS